MIEVISNLIKIGSNSLDQNPTLNEKYKNESYGDINKLFEDVFENVSGKLNLEEETESKELPIYFDCNEKRVVIFDHDDNIIISGQAITSETLVNDDETGKIRRFVVDHLRSKLNICSIESIKYSTDYVSQYQYKVTDYEVKKERELVNNDPSNSLLEISDSDSDSSVDDVVTRMIKKNK